MIDRICSRGLIAPLLLAATIAVPGSAQSFDCARASTPQELLICANPRMRALDGELGAAYTSARSRLSEAARLDIRRAQREWLAYWPISCREGRAPLNPRDPRAQACAVEKYTERLAVLRGDITLPSGIRIYPSNSYLIGRSTAEGGSSTYAYATRQVLRVDLGNVPPGRSPLASAIDRWLRDGFPDEFGLDPEMDSETTMSIFPSLPFLLSVNIGSFMYGHGAAHPNSGATVRHFNLAAGRVMTVGDIFSRPGWEDPLTAFVERALRRELDDMYNVESTSELRDKVIEPTRWRFEKNTLTIGFDAYEVAPYAAGPQAVAVPWSVIAPWLTDAVRRNVLR